MSTPTRSLQDAGVLAQHEAKQLAGALTQARSAAEAGRTDEALAHVTRFVDRATKLGAPTSLTRDGKVLLDQIRK
ncbi:FIMAH domain-containing protein [Dactylosporangium salmoneum]|uniref:FIMAH domain-containing protein n=1 Tax=Dactylosporangium salmoneum TaxID=53361 RepID=A0ABN3GQ96_9ACTN